MYPEGAKALPGHQEHNILEFPNPIFPSLLHRLQLFSAHKHLEVSRRIPGHRYISHNSNRVVWIGVLHRVYIFQAWTLVAKHKSL
jgi:hypothetical protein